MCDFAKGAFTPPEMCKRRPAIVLSPKIKNRPGLCTVVALSTTEPDPVMPYHGQIRIKPKLPKGMESDAVWIKGDMVNAVGFHRLDLINLGKDMNGKRQYLLEPIEDDQFEIVQRCVLRAMGFSSLTKHL